MPQRFWSGRGNSSTPEQLGSGENALKVKKIQENAPGGPDRNGLQQSDGGAAKKNTKSVRGNSLNIVHAMKTEAGLTFVCRPFLKNIFKVFLKNLKNYFFVREFLKWSEILI